MAVNDITVLQEQADGSQRETILTRSLLGADAVYSGYGDRHFGPFAILQNYSTVFQNSNYSSGITASTPTSQLAGFGWFAVGNSNVTVNPFDIFGVGSSYRVRASVRVSGAFNDGVRCLIRRVVIGVGESSIPGLVNFGSGVSEIYQATSDPIVIGVNSTQWEYYRIYFAAFNGGNGATPQDVAITLLRAS
jgi:hypothetical protein